jgi:hypothetical protein
MAGLPRPEYPATLAQSEARCLTARRDAARVEGASLVGLALSGGGIRSATFGLGLIRALARAGLLRRIDFLSTVSGGGYIGSFLGALYARPDPAGVREGPNRAENVEAALASTTSTLVGRLREDGRYLSPNGSGDTLLAASVMLRNWIAIQVVVGAGLLTLFVAGDALRLLVTSESWKSELLTNRAVAGRIWWSAWLALPPLVLATWVVPCAWAYWLVGRPDRHPDRWRISSLFVRFGASWGRLSLLLVPMIFVPGLHDPLEHLFRANPFSAWTSLATLAGSVWDAPLAVLRDALPGGKLRSLSVFVLVSAAVATLALLAGRRGLSVALKSGVLVTAAVLLFALVDSAGQTLYALTTERRGLWRWLAPVPAALAAAGPFAQKLLALLKPTEPRKRPRLPLAVLSLLAAAVVAGTFTVVVAALGDAISWNGAKPPRHVVEGMVGAAQPVEPATANGAPSTATAATDRPPTEAAPAPDEPGEAGRLVAVLLLLTALSWCLGRAFSFLNDSTLAPLYAARLRRAYLGASNRTREKDGSRRAVTNDVEDDDIDLAKYRPWQNGGPLHLINVTLNETTNGSSQIEQRDRRGLGMAFGPGGISVGVHHHAVWKTPGNFEEGLAAVPLAGRFEVFPSTDQKPICPEPLELSRLVAISGAAVSTGIGSRTSLGISLFLGLLNLRLGHWWYSGVDPRRRSVRVRTLVASWLRNRRLVKRVRRWWRGGTEAPELEDARARAPAALGVWGALGRFCSRQFPVQTHLLHEFLARFPGPASRNWYLSDGGHFENSGCYELIRRRLPLIIVSDCGADPEYEFTDFAHLVRKARLDFGARIRLATSNERNRIDSAVRAHFADPGVVRRRRADSETDEAFAPIDEERRWNGAHALLCFVDYDADPEHSSVLVWIKPSLCGDEPPDVLNYAQGCRSFPQESTADQYFDEGQWESYHRLGLLIGERLFGGGPASEGMWHPASLDPSALLVARHRTPQLVGRAKFG